MGAPLESARVPVRLIVDKLDLRLADSFDDRLVLQKVVYLMQRKGFQIGYSYRWYLRGPYSSELTKDAFAVVDWPEIATGRVLTGPANEFIDKIVEPPEGISEVDWLELVATVAWYGPRNEWQRDVMESTVRRVKRELVLRLGERLTNAVDLALATLKEEGMTAAVR